MIGNYLKEKREEKGYTLKAISQHTKITISLLERLERNKFEDLPSKAYVAGFVKSYSKILGLDINESLDILDETYSNYQPSSVSNPKTNLASGQHLRRKQDTEKKVKKSSNKIN